MKITILTIISFFFSTGYWNNTPSNNSVTSWKNLLEASHKIGFCVYHTDRKHCTEHKETYENLIATALPDEDVNYFYIHQEWAENRIQNWAKKQNSEPSKFLILFDIDQGTISKRRPSSSAGSAYNSFSIINLSIQLKLEQYLKTQNETSFKIQSNSKNSILTNTLWREFMTMRLGILVDEIRISVTGENAETDSQEFERQFIEFQKEFR